MVRVETIRSILENGVYKYSWFGGKREKSVLPNEDERERIFRRFGLSLVV